MKAETDGVIEREKERFENKNDKCKWIDGYTDIKEREKDIKRVK